MAPEAIIDRVRKLLSLAGNNTNVNEAATAAALAQKLMLEHKLAASDVETGETPDDEPIGLSTLNEDGRQMATWRSNLMANLAINNFCRIVLSNNPQLGGVACFKIIGKQSDADAVSYLFRYLTKEIDRLADEEGSMGKAWKNSFRLGAVAEISNRLSEQRREQEKAFRAGAEMGHAKSSTALVILKGSDESLEAYKKKAFPHLRAHYGSGPSRGDGYASGKAAGATVGLPGKSKGIGAAPKQIGGAR